MPAGIDQQAASSRFPNPSPLIPARVSQTSKKKGTNKISRLFNEHSSIRRKGSNKIGSTQDQV